MTDKKPHQTLMFQEAGEAHTRAAQQLSLNEKTLSALGQSLRRRPPPFVMICARGSSSHAGVYARYLIETRLGIPTLPAALSVSSVYAKPQNLTGVLCLAISQSGQSPDILAAAKAAKRGGAMVVALVNDTHSPLAQMCDAMVPLHAGPERSVAATKTFICSLTALAQIAAYWGQSDDLKQGLTALPEQLAQAFEVQWDEALVQLKTTPSLFVVSRGLSLSVAKEAALKFKETCALHAEAFSAAEVMHGPMALVKDNFPVAIIAAHDATQDSIDTVASKFISRSSGIITIGKNYDGALSLHTEKNRLPELNPILTIQTVYRFVNALSLSRGLNPDAPEYLNKVTETL